MRTSLAECERGIAAIEAAIVFPILISLVLGSLEFGMLFYTYNSLQTATREVARQISVNYITATAATASIVAQLPSWAGSTVTVTVAQTFPADSTKNVITVVAAVPLANATPIHLFTTATAGLVLRSEVVMKQELPM